MRIFRIGCPVSQLACGTSLMVTARAPVYIQPLDTHPKSPTPTLLNGHGVRIVQPQVRHDWQARGSQSGQPRPIGVQL